MKADKEFGKQKSTTIFNNDLWIKSYEKGVIIKAKNKLQGVSNLSEIRLTNIQAGDVSLQLRKHSYPKLFTEPQLDLIKRKFQQKEEEDNPLVSRQDVIDFVDRIINDDIKYEEFSRM